MEVWYSISSMVWWYDAVVRCDGIVVDVDWLHKGKKMYSRYSLIHFFCIYGLSTKEIIVQLLDALNEIRYMCDI